MGLMVAAALFSIRLEEEGSMKDSDACKTLSQDALR